MWPNMWDITAGGHVLAGEFGFQAAIREAKEELGIELDKNDMTFIGSSISTNIKGDIIDIDTKEKLDTAHKNILSSLISKDKEKCENAINLHYDIIDDVLNS